MSISIEHPGQAANVEHDLVGLLEVAVAAVLSGATMPYDGRLYFVFANNTQGTFPARFITQTVIVVRRFLSPCDPAA
jgi:hypothetical protein